MKRLVLLLSLTIYFTQSGYTQDIQNSGFENWTTEVLFEEPDQFTTSNILSYPSIGEPNVTKTSDAYSGNYAVKLETVAVDEESLFGAILIGELVDEGIIGGVPFTERPDFIKGYAKYNVPAGDTAYVLALFKKLGIPLGVCIVPFIGEQAEYQEFSAPIEWYHPILAPDTLATGVLSSKFVEPIPGSWIIVDSIHFVGASTPYPNGNFEDWTTFASEEPDNWFTSNVFTILAGNASVTKSEESYEGDFAVRIENTLTMWDDTLGIITNGTFGDDGPMGGMPVNNIPNLLSGYYKYTPVGQDTALAGITLFYYNEVTGMTEILEENFIKLPAAGSYTYFELQVDYYSLPNPDTLNIAFSSGNLEEDTNYVGLGSVLFIDALEITYKPPVGINESITEKNHRVYPNPATEKLFFEVYELMNKDITLTIVNSQGQVVYNSKTYLSGNNKTEVDISRLPGGIYFYNLRYIDRHEQGKFVIE